MLRALSAAQANACENAQGGRCRCRCGGAFHGAQRTEDPTSLPDGDPHATEGQRSIYDELPK